MLNTTDCNELVSALTDTNQLLLALLSDPLIPADNKEYIRSRFTQNKLTLEGARKELSNG